MLTNEEREKIERALMNLERARVEADEVLDELTDLNEATVCHAEGLVSASTLSLEYAQHLLEDFLRDGERTPADSELTVEGVTREVEKVRELRERTGCAAIDARKYLSEANWDLEQAAQAVIRQGQA